MLGRGLFPPILRHSHLTEYIAICKAVAIGFGVMGFIGYFVKLVSRPTSITNLMVQADNDATPDTYSHHQDPRRIVVGISLSLFLLAPFPGQACSSVM